MPWHAATCGMTNLSLYQGTGNSKSVDFLGPSDTQFIRKNSNNSRNNMKSQRMWNY